MNIFTQWIVDNKLWLLLALATFFGYFWLVQFKNKLQINDIAAFLLSVIHTVIGVLCVKAFAFLESGEAGGMSLYGAVFFLPVVYFIGAKITKLSPEDVFDIFTINTVFTLLCARLNCIFSGCCLGKPIPGTNGWLWPTRELEIIFYIILLILLGKRVGKAKYKARIYPTYMIAYGTFRFVIEWFRESDNLIFGNMHISHIWSLIAIAAGVIVCYVLKYIKTANKKKRHKAPQAS
ncbi:MAG: prolipoprotein diacylglyceryl transferase [Oscillospiraceae bacterium]|nr:prolipoprotein diacylglyceryl transferase [Oscillospiraceae bacterium]